MRLFILILMLLAFPIPANALDVSVVGDQSRVNSLNSLRARVETLTDAISTQAEILTTTTQEVARMRNCAATNMIHDASSITAANPSGCVSVPPDLEALANTLNCVDGEAVKFVGGNLECAHPMEACRFEVDKVLTQHRYSPADNNGTCVKSGKVSTVLSTTVISYPVQVTDGSYNISQGIPADQITPNPPFRLEGNIHRDWPGFVWSCYANLNPAGVITPFNIRWPRRHARYRYESEYTYENKRLVCN